MKFLAILCVLLVGTAQSTPVKPGDALSDLVLQIVNAIVQLVDTAINYGEQIVDYAGGDGLDKLQADAEQIILQVVEFIEDRFQQRVDGATDLDADGLKLWNCIKNDKDNWNTGILSYYDGLTKCVNPTVKDLIKLVTPLLEDVRSIEKQASDHAQALPDCADADCTVGILLQIIDDIMGLPDTVAPEIQAFVDEWPILEAKAVDCSLSAFGDFFDKIFADLSAAAKCANS